MIDRMQLEYDANTVLTAEILRSIIVPEAKPREICGHCDGTGKVLKTLPRLDSNECSACKGTGKTIVPVAFWPGIDRPLQERYEWWKAKGILKDPDDRYPYYFAVAKQCRPLIIAEIGVYYGYSLMCMAQGAMAGGVRNIPGENVTVNGFDNEQYVFGCLEWARQAFMDERIACNLMHLDTQKAKSLPLHMVQLASIDGDHSYESALHDLRIMEPCMVPRPRLDAVYIVDDVGWALSVRQAAEDFAKEFGYSVIMLPTHKGTAILERA